METFRNPLLPSTPQVKHRQRYARMVQNDDWTHHETPLRILLSDIFGAQIPDAYGSHSHVDLDTRSLRELIIDSCVVFTRNSKIMAAFISKDDSTCSFKHKIVAQRDRQTREQSLSIFLYKLPSSPSPHRRGVDQTPLSNKIQGHPNPAKETTQEKQGSLPLDGITLQPGQ
jgi:hypothetical protein